MFKNEFFHKTIANLDCNISTEILESIFSYLDRINQVYNGIRYFKIKENDYVVFHRKEPGTLKPIYCIIYKNRGYLLKGISNQEGSKYRLTEEVCGMNSLKMNVKIFNLLKEEKDVEILDMLKFTQHFYSYNNRKFRYNEKVKKDTIEALNQVKSNKKYFEILSYYSEINYDFKYSFEDDLNNKIQNPFDAVVTYMLQFENIDIVLGIIEKMIKIRPITDGINIAYLEVPYSESIAVFSIAEVHLSTKSKKIEVITFNENIKRIELMEGIKAHIYFLLVK